MRRAGWAGDALTPLTVGLFIGALLGICMSGCKTTQHLQEQRATEWKKTEAATSTASATTAKAEASRKFTKRRQIVKKADGSSTETTTETVEDLGVTTQVSATATQTAAATATGKETRAVEQHKQTQPSGLPWWVYAIVLGLFAAAMLYAFAWPWLKARVLGVFRRG